MLVCAWSISVQDPREFHRSEPRIIVRSDDCRAFPVDHDSVAERPRNRARRARIAGYPIIKSRGVKPAEARNAILQLTDPATYFPSGEGWLCLFEPGYVLHAEGPKGAVDFVICFKCGDVDVGGEMHSVLQKAEGKLRQTVERLMSPAK